MDYTVFGADEVWLPVLGYEGHYEVSSHGQVRTVAKMTKRGWREQITRKTVPDTHGYRALNLKVGGVSKRSRVHVLLLEAFVGARPGMQVCHRNDIADDNRIWNLYWGTAADNTRDKMRHGTNAGPPRKTHCPAGHPYNEENTVIDTEGYPSCRICRRVNSYRGWMTRRAKKLALEAGGTLEESCTEM